MLNAGWTLLKAEDATHHVIVGRRQIRPRWCRRSAHASLL